MHSPSVLERLHHATRELMLATTAAEAEALAVETIETELAIPLAAFFRYQDGRLEPTAWTAESVSLVDTLPTYEPGNSLSWRVFERGTEQVVDDIHAEPDAYNQLSPARSEIILPVGEFGVLNVVSTQVEAFDETDMRFADIVAANTEAALHRIQREQHLKAQNERLEWFSRIISHDLRSPLNVAYGNVQFIADEYDSDRVKSVKESLELMADLIDDLLVLTRSDLDLGDRTTVALSDLVDAAWGAVDTSTATVTVDSERVLDADESQVTQVLVNLFGNSVEHAPDGVNVRVGALDDGIYVEDDGPGIPESDRDRLFEAGFTTNRNGTGIGLAIVDRIVTAHGWTVHATESESGGARFEIAGMPVD